MEERHELRRPRQGHAVLHEGARRPRGDRAAARLRGGRPRHGAGRARGMREFNEERARAAEPSKATATRRPGRTASSRRRPGFKEAFRQFGEGGWQGLQHPAEFGGQGLPKTIGAACIEMINSANLSFALCPLLTDGAIEALLTAGSREQQERLPAEDDLRRVDRHDEPDRAAGRLRPGAGAHARRAAAATARYRLFGTKIFITYGEHDMAENIVHLVLARVAGAPEGVKGISLFIVPEVPGQRRRLARRAQRRALRQHRAQARHQGEPDGGAAVRRPAAARRRATPGRRGEPRPRVHVHHDERGALRGRHAGHRGRRARLPEGGGVREGARAVAAGRRLGRRQRDRSSTTPTCGAC